MVIIIYYSYLPAEYQQKEELSVPLQAPPNIVR